MKKALLILFAAFVAFSFTSDEDKLEKAPEIELIGVNGKKVKLSSLKGKMVLIDFWASWCGPCRRENPNVVEAYLEFKDQKFKGGKGFEVFSVSLDKTQDAWKKAILDDGLLWQSHVIDSNGEASRLYQVRFIPTAFLVDGKGSIVAQGESLRGEGLQTTLRALLNK